MKRIVHDVEIKNMIRLANDAKGRAYAPYSNFHVGACLKGKSGAYYLACNVENASISASICAERAAIYKAFSEAERGLDVLCMITSGSQPTVPCGVCMQVISELCEPDMPIISANNAGKYQIFYAGDLLPHSFGAEDLK